MTDRAPAGRRALTGSVAIPGDKSISHRCLLLGALSTEPSRIEGIAPGDDVAATAEALSCMGMEVGEQGPDLVVTGFGLRGARAPDSNLDLRNSGTGLRTLLPLCASGSGTFVLTGDETLKRRPMLRVVSPLRSMGAEISGPDGGRLPPLSVRGGPLRGTRHVLEVASAQVKTALLLAGLSAEGKTEVINPAPSRDHTERMLKALGVRIAGDDLEQSVDGRETLPAGEWKVPRDPSSAMFLIAAATLIPGSSIEIADVCLNPFRIGAFEVLRDMGGDIEWTVSGSWGGEPVGTVQVRSASLHGVDIPDVKIPALVDEIPLLAILAAFAEGETRVTGAQELRVKESDRIRSISEGLRAVGGSVTDLPDGLVIEGGRPLRAGTVDSYGDHRIAMSFAIAGLAAEEEIAVRGWSSVDTSFPSFLATVRGAQGR